MSRRAHNMSTTTRKVIYLQLPCLRYSELQAFLSAKECIFLIVTCLKSTKEVEEIGNENSKKKYSIPESFGTALQFYMIHEWMFSLAEIQKPTTDNPYKRESLSSNVILHSVISLSESNYIAQTAWNSWSFSWLGLPCSSGIVTTLQSNHIQSDFYASKWYFIRL